MSKKILIITYYFPPSGGAGVQRWLKFVKYLPQFGYDPVVLTVNEKEASYPQIDESLLNDIPDSVRVERTHTREILNVYKRISPSKEIPYGGFANEQKTSLFQKISRFIRGNFFLPDPRRGWNKYAYRRACQLIESEQIETIVTTSPPHSTQLIGLKLKKKYPNIQWVVDLRDPWRDIYYYKELYPCFLADSINALYEKQVLIKSDKLITVSRGVKELFEKKADIADKFFIIPNGFDEPDFVNVLPNKKNDKFVISYVGILSSLYNVDPFLDAVNLLPEAEKQNILLRFVGKTASQIQEKIFEKGLGQMTEFIDYVPHKEAVAYMKGSDLLLLLLPDSEKNKGILTGKLFEYMASETPVLLVASLQEDAAGIIDECKAGKTFDYCDVEGIKRFILDTKKVDKLQSETQLYQKYSRKELTRLLGELLGN